MNDIAKKAASEKFLSVLKKENLSKNEAGAILNLKATQVSYLFNEKYWGRLGNTGWDKLLKWVNSGQGLSEWSEKHGKVIPEKKTPNPIKRKTLTTEGIIPRLEKEAEIQSLEIQLEQKEKPTLLNLLKERRTFLIEEINAIDNLLRHYIS